MSAPNLLELMAFRYRQAMESRNKQLSVAGPAAPQIPVDKAMADIATFVNFVNAWLHSHPATVVQRSGEGYEIQFYGGDKVLLPGGMPGGGAEESLLAPDAVPVTGVSEYRRLASDEPESPQPDFEVISGPVDLRSGDGFPRMPGV
jgi:hypothetical protein